ncbi:helix-turn-helix domain-containing protein [Stenotrophomonas acidaminiphila]|uniref:helix-turn-helix domain-containing protein n=1 Tax=Stenotrophomonas acidaminiphila TaxID=128780 RepID=UPI0015F9628B|nr:helix-turn-helix transcriptional regulator [Stenotrophomonas acidaminiphila]
MTRDTTHPPASRATFAKNFRSARKKAGMTQQDVRDKTGFSLSFISELENGHCGVNLDNMELLAAAVGVPLWKLLTP